MGWRDYLGDTQVEKLELLDKPNLEAGSIRVISVIPVIPVNTGGLAENPTPLHEHLTEVEREVSSEYAEWALSNGAKKETAETEATDFICRTRNVLHAQQAAEDYRKRGYVQIWSNVLGRAVYLARDQGVIVPDDHPVFTEQDIAACKGLDRDQAQVLLEAKLILGGRLTSEQSMRGHSQKGEV